uniref:Uncharacterized protein n=1 Tax=Nannospalax galili TaxID=1026970 RepID=A0A8C6W9P0_NANGA
MGLNGRQSPLLISLWLLVTSVHPGTGLENSHYVPQLSRAALEGKLTQSTFTLEQPQGLFDNLNISDSDPIQLVVAHSNATQNFAAPQKIDDKYAPASFTQNGYYLTLRTSRVHYQGGRPGKQLQVLHVGNDTSFSLKSKGCNSPLPGSGPYRVKFLVMGAKGPMAETEWSKEAQTFRAVPGSQSEGIVAIIAFLSILLAVLLASFLILVLSSGSTSVSSSVEQVRMR